MKNFSLTRIREVFPEFNSRPITEAEFWRACKKFKIIVKEMPLLVDGYHERKNGRYYIIINKKLNGVKWLHTAFHEFCHFLFDVPETRENYVFYRSMTGSVARENGSSDAEEIKRRRRQREKFADAFGLACLIPKGDLIQLTLEDHSDSADLWLYAARIEALSEFKF